MCGPVFKTSILAALLRVPTRVWTGYSLPSSLWQWMVTGVQSGPIHSSTSALIGRPLDSMATWTISREASDMDQVWREVPSIFSTGEIWFMFHSAVLEVTPGLTAESWVEEVVAAWFGATEKAFAAVKAERARKLENFILELGD